MTSRRGRRLWIGAAVAALAVLVLAISIATSLLGIAKAMRVKPNKVLAA